MPTHLLANFCRKRAAIHLLNFDGQRRFRPRIFVRTGSLFKAGVFTRTSCDPWQVEGRFSKAKDFHPLEQGRI
jgi:hypothetical protein